MSEHETKSYRFGYDPLDINPALRIEANERLAALQFQTMEARFDKLEAAMARLERRLWLAVSGVATAALVHGAISLLEVTP